MVQRNETLELRRLGVDLGPAYLAMVDEYEAAGGRYPHNNAELARADFAAFVRELDGEARGIGLPPDVAPQQTFVLVRVSKPSEQDNHGRQEGDTVLGEIRFRPTLAPPYESDNGHIGYNIRPSARGQGYATRQLALMLEEARRAGLAGVMLPVEGENPASVRVIEKNGGRLARTTTDAESGETVRHYWIALA